jgi:hypothetical protein
MYFVQVYISYAAGLSGLSKTYGSAVIFGFILGWCTIQTGQYFTCTPSELDIGCGGYL